MKLKHPQGWFAAGREVSRAIEVLSDAAFKLYIYICLHAERNTGCLDLVETNMTRALGKSPQLIEGYMEEMERQGVCRRWHAGKDQDFDQIEVCDDFWPYEKDSRRARSNDETQYLERIRQLLTGHRCMAIALPPQIESSPLSSTKRVCRRRMCGVRFCSDAPVNARRCLAPRSLSRSPASSTSVQSSKKWGSCRCRLTIGAI